MKSPIFQTEAAKNQFFKFIRNYHKLQENIIVLKFLKSN